MGVNGSKIAAELAGLVGSENVSTRELDLLCYARDMAPMPDELLETYGMLPPEAVARPGTPEEVASLLKYAAGKKVPVTPRAGGSWALGGTIPIEGGLVLDVGRLDRILEINEADRWVRVQGSVTWKRLSDSLARKGLRVGTYPSSAPSATVAGFLATGGSGGIGASLHGPAGDQVLSLKVALTDGRVIETDPWTSWLFTGSEGTLGVICEAVLRVFALEPMYHAMVGFDEAAPAWEAFRGLYGMRPYFLTCIDRGFAEALNESAKAAGGRSSAPSQGALTAGSHAHGGAAGEHHAIPEKNFAFVACFTGPDRALAEVRSEVEKRWGKHLYDQALARSEWENRFDAVLSTKRLGPTIFSPEIQVPLAELPDVFAELERVMAPRRHAIEGMAIGGGAVTLLPVIYTDERDAADFLKVFSYTRDITDVAYRHGGCIYGVGLHNSNHMGKIHRDGLDVMRLIRSRIEKSGTLNPSKTTQIRVPYWMLRTAMSFMDGLPHVVSAGLRMAGLLPRPLMRFALRVLGGQLR